MAIHSGTADYRDAGILRNILGGVLHHPEQCPVMVEAKENMLLPDLPFNIRWHYFMEIDNADKIHVFLTAASQHGIQPAGWTRYHGAGRVCVPTPGHNLWMYGCMKVTRFY